MADEFPPSEDRPTLTADDILAEHHTIASECYGSWLQYLQQSGRLGEFLQLGEASLGLVLSRDTTSVGAEEHPTSVTSTDTMALQQEPAQSLPSQESSTNLTEGATSHPHLLEDVVERDSSAHHGEFAVVYPDASVLADATYDNFDFDSRSSTTSPAETPYPDTPSSSSVQENHAELGCMGESPVVEPTHPEPLESAIQAPMVEVQLEQRGGVQSGFYHPSHRTATPQYSQQFIPADITTYGTPPYHIPFTHYFPHPSNVAARHPSSEGQLQPAVAGSPSSHANDGQHSQNSAAIVNSDVARQTNGAAMYPPNHHPLSYPSNVPLPHPSHPSYYLSAAGPSSYEDGFQYRHYKENLPVAPLAPVEGTIAVDSHPVPAASERVIAPLPTRARARNPSIRAALPPSGDAMTPSIPIPSTVSNSAVPTAEAPLQYGDEYLPAALQVNHQPTAAQLALRALPQTQAQASTSRAGYKRRELIFKPYTGEDYHAPKRRRKSNKKNVDAN